MYDQLNTITITLLQKNTQISPALLEQAIFATKENASLFEYLFRNRLLKPNEARKILSLLLQQKISCSRCQNILTIQPKPLQFRCDSCLKSTLDFTSLPTEAIIPARSFSTKEEVLTSSVPEVDFPFRETLAYQSIENLLSSHSSGELLQLEDLSDSQIQNVTKKGSRFRIGKYEVIEEIGRGGMGIVYRVYQPDLQKYFALKLLLNSELSSEEQVERFKNEAQIVASLDHPNIVRIQDLGQQDHYWFYSNLFCGQLQTLACTMLENH